VRARLEPLVVLIVAALVLGLVLPAHGTVAVLLDRLVVVAVMVLFFLYGARLTTSQVLDGVRAWKLQGSMLAATYLVFPALGLAAQLLPDAVLAPSLRTGLLYLTLLPSTVQSSVVLTSIARGNVAGAVTGATVSNVLGIVVTPLLVVVLLGGQGVVGSGGVLRTLGMLLVPFLLGQVAGRWIGPWLRAHRRVTKVSDQSTIVLVAYVAVSAATVSGTWDEVTVVSLLGLLVVSAALLAIMLGLTWVAGGWWGMDRADRVALLMCGSKKSLATGLPMAAILLPATMAATVALPVVIFHQMQIIVCAALARRLARGTTEPAA